MMHDSNKLRGWQRVKNIARQNLSNSLSTMLTYRGNLLFFFLFETLFLFAHFLSIKLGFELAGGSIAGWNRDEAYLLTAIVGFTHHLFICLCINPLFMMPLHVWSGQFDYILLKPMPPLAAAWAMSETPISNFPNLVLNFLIMVALATKVQFAGHSLDILACLVTLLLGLLVRVALALLCIAPVFFSERLVGIEEAYWSIAGLGRYPLGIYPRWLELAFTIIVPLWVIGTLPAGLFTGRYGLADFAISVLATAVFTATAYFLFSLCIKRYRSVNAGI